MCVEEIALKLGYVMSDQVRARASVLGKAEFARYTIRRANEVAGA